LNEKYVRLGDDYGRFGDGMERSEAEIDRGRELERGRAKKIKVYRRADIVMYVGQLIGLSISRYFHGYLHTNFI
jgi:hypothetical protein